MVIFIPVHVLNVLVNMLSGPSLESLASVLAHIINASIGKSHSVLHNTYIAIAIAIAISSMHKKNIIIMNHNN